MACGRWLSAQGFRQEVFELFYEIWRVFEQNLHLGVNRVLEHTESADRGQQSDGHQTHVVEMTSFFLICLQDLQKCLVCSLIIRIAQLDSRQVLDRMVELSRLSRAPYDAESVCPARHVSKDGHCGIVRCLRWGTESGR